MGVEDVDAPEGANTLSMDVRVVDGMVPKVEFDRAIEAAQQALRAKTASSQQMLTQASSACLLYTSPSPRDATLSRMPSSA